MSNHKSIIAYTVLNSYNFINILSEHETTLLNIYTTGHYVNQIDATCGCIRRKSHVNT